MCARPCAVGAAKNRVGRALPGSGLPYGTSVCVIRVSLDGKNEAVVYLRRPRHWPLLRFSTAALTDVH